MQVIPLQAVPNQEVNVLLSNQPCKIEVVQRRTGMFLNLYVNNVLILGGVACLDRNRIVRDAYFDFVGDLSFFDTHATAPNYTDGAEPVYSELGDRFLFVYLDPADLS